MEYSDAEPPSDRGEAMLALSEKAECLRMYEEGGGGCTCFMAVWVLNVR